MESSPAVSSRLIGAIFVERGLITDAQLEQALVDQAASGDRLGEILVQRYGVPRLELASALAEQWAELERPRDGERESAGATDTTRDADDLRAVSSEWTESEAEPRRPIGEIFLERGLVTTDQLDSALSEQQQTGERLGEILVSKGIVDRVDLASALADQWANLPKLRPPGTEAENSRAAAASSAAVDDLRTAIDELTARVDSFVEVHASSEPSATAGVADPEAEQLRSAVHELKAWAEEERTIGRDTGNGSTRRCGVSRQPRVLQAGSTMSNSGSTVDATAAVLAETAATLRHDIDALTAAVQLVGEQKNAELAAVREELAGLAHGLEVRDDASARLSADLAGRLAAVESRPLPEPAAGLSTGDLEEIWRVLSDLGSRLDDRVGELHARIEAHAAEGFELDAAQAEANGSVLARVEELAETVEALGVAAASGDAARDELARGVLETLDSRVGELQERLAAGVASGEELRARVDELAGVVASLGVDGDREEKGSSAARSSW